MKLILTGHDYAGKSTILKELWKREDNGKMSYIHLSYREPTNKEFYSQTLEYSNFLMDRCFLDELIYPYVFKRERNLSDEEAIDLLNKCREKGITLVIVACSIEELKRRIETRKDIREEPEVLANLVLIRNMYFDLAKKLGIPVVDTSGKTPEVIVSEVDEIIKGNTHIIK